MIRRALLAATAAALVGAVALPAVAQDSSANAVALPS